MQAVCVSANRYPNCEGAVTELAVSQIQSVWTGARPQSRTERTLLGLGRPTELGEGERCPDLRAGGSILFSRPRGSFP